MLSSLSDQTHKHFDPSKVEEHQKLSALFNSLRDALNQSVMGQNVLIDRLLIALLADGHLLVEGTPGLAKTRAIKALSTFIHSSFHRVQFTPDLLPADLTGTEVYRMETGSFEFQTGPLFHNLILADEINRAPAKVQSALLEAMAERQITIGKKTYPLPAFFLVMATQNPIEQEGTYPLPEAQLDRFLMKILVDYPAPEKEIEIMNLVLKEARYPMGAKFACSLKTPQQSNYLGLKITEEDILSSRNAVLDLYMAKNVQQYIVQLVLATRSPGKYSKELGEWIQYGASPRASIAFARSAKALAFLDGFDFVGPEHVQALAHDVLRHRILLSYRAEAQGITPEMCIRELLSKVPVP